MTKKNKEQSNFQWYIATTYSGREDSVVRDLQAKIKALNLDEDVKTIRVFKVKSVTEKIFDASNPPPAHMRNSKNIRWEAGNKPGTYKKIESRIINKFPGYIFIEMILNDKVWLAIRNSFYITGFIGSSGKGAKPIPISSEELETMLKEDPNIQLEEGEVVSDIVESTIKKDEEEELLAINLDVGDEVKVKLGQWKDQIGIVKLVDYKTGNITISTDFLGSENLIEVKYDNLEKIIQE